MRLAKRLPKVTAWFGIVLLPLAVCGTTSELLSQTPSQATGTPKSTAEKPPDNSAKPSNAPSDDKRPAPYQASRNVVEFGAKCDGVTDDSVAIQAAFDYAYDSPKVDPHSGKNMLRADGVELSFPVGTCYVAHTINYRGEAFHGVSISQSFIKGPPHDDVFAAIDVSDSPKRPCCFQGTRSHDITIMIDISEDVTTSAAWAARGRGQGQGSVFANRFEGWAGQTIKGPVTAEDSTIPLTKAVDLTQYKANGYAPWGWVKIGSEYVHYQGITTTGCKNSAPLCLLNAKRGITLAGKSTASASYADGTPISPVNPLEPSNVTDWIPAWTVGPCGFAFPGRDGRKGGSNPWQHGWLDHVKFMGYGANDPKGACDIFIQGAAYAIKVSNLYDAYTTLGIVIAPAFTNTDYPLSHAISSDDMQFSNLELNSTVPFTSYIGGVSNINNLTAYVSASPLQQATGLSLWSLPCHSSTGGCRPSEMGGININGIYQESNTGGGVIKAYPPLAQMDGVGVINGGFIGVFGPQSLNPIVWGSNSSVANVSFGYGGPPALVVTGNGNTFTNTPPGSAQVVDLGFNNTFTSSNTQYGNRSLHNRAVRTPANKLTPDFLFTGSVNEDWYQSLDDLFFTPEDMVNIVVQTVGTKVVNDESVPLTGRYIPIKSPGTFPAIGVRATGTKVGQDSPKGKGTFYVALKAEAAATQSWQVICNSSALNTASFKLTTSWAVYSMPYDATSCKVGSSGLFGLPSGATSPATATQLAWEGFVPEFDVLNAANANLGSLTLRGKPSNPSHAQSDLKSYQTFIANDGSWHFRMMNDAQNAQRADMPSGVATFEMPVASTKFVGVISSESDIAFSPTPKFSATVNLNYIHLTGNVTSSTLPAGADGQMIEFVICQDVTGARAFTWPSNVRGGGTVGQAASTCSVQDFTYVGALSKWISRGAIQTGL